MDSIPVLSDAVREALGFVIAELRREWRRELELMAAQGRERDAQARETIANLRVENTELRAAMADQVTSRLASLRDGKDGAPGEPGRPGEAIVGPAGEKGACGDKGDPGPPGGRGNGFTAGQGFPNSDEVIPGDVYLDLETGDVYEFRS